MPVMILGHPIYPLVPWLVKPYTGHLDIAKERFSYQLSGYRMTAEWALGRLKGCRCCLLIRVALNEANIPLVIVVYCVISVR